MNIASSYKSLFLIGISLAFLFSGERLQGQTLASYIAEAQRNNPKISALSEVYSIQKEKINEVGGLPNTQFSAGVFTEKSMTLMGEQRFQFSVMQPFPWFGTLSTRKDYQNAQAAVAQTSIAIGKRQLALKVAQSYYELYALKAKRNVTDSIVSLLTLYEKLALKAIETDKASAVDVLKLQIQKNNLLEQKAVLLSRFKAEKTRFLNLLNRKNADKRLIIPDSLSIPLDIKASVIEQPKIEGHPELLKFDKMEKAVSALEKVNQKEAAPQLGLGLEYMPMSALEGMNIGHGGKDMFMPMISVSIPIFTHKYASRSRQNELKQKNWRPRKSTVPIGFRPHW